ncbi:hypothetical protein ACLKA6_011263 [Drosophila palustris]
MYAESTTTEMTTYAPREPPEKSTLRDFWAKESAVNAFLQTSQVNTQFLVQLSSCPLVHSLINVPLETERHNDTTTRRHEMQLGNTAASAASSANSAAKVAALGKASSTSPFQTAERFMHWNN